MPAGHTARNAASPQNSTDVKVQCYNCKEYGHYASKCPRASTPCLRAARVVEATPEVEEAPPKGDEATGQEEEPQKDETDLPEGEAMYESEEEYYDPDGSQYCSSEEYEAAYSDEEEDAVPQRVVVPKQATGAGAKVAAKRAVQDSHAYDGRAGPRDRGRRTGGGAKPFELDMDGATLLGRRHKRAVDGGVGPVACGVSRPGTAAGAAEEGGAAEWGVGGGVVRLPFGCELLAVLLGGAREGG